MVAAVLAAVLFACHPSGATGGCHLCQTGSDDRMRRKRWRRSSVWEVFNMPALRAVMCEGNIVQVCNGGTASMFPLLGFCRTMQGTGLIHLGHSETGYNFTLWSSISQDGNAFTRKMLRLLVCHSRIARHSSLRLALRFRMQHRDTKFNSRVIKNGASGRHELFYLERGIETMKPKGGPTLELRNSGR